MLVTILRRFLGASGLVFATSLMTSATFAENVTIGGTVVSTLAISSSISNVSIDLAAGKTNATFKAADLTMGTNNSNGLSVVVTGTLTLVNPSAETSVPFTVGIVEGASGEPLSYVATGAQVFSTSSAAASSTVHSLYIKYSTDARFQDPGVYRASLILIPSDN